MVIMNVAEQWLVYATDERASKITGSEKKFKTEEEASVRLAVHLPLEIRQTHSPSPVRVRGSLGWISRTTPRAAVLVQS